MEGFNIAEAKAQFSELVERAMSGEEIEIRKRGEPVAKLVPIKASRKRLDVDALRALTAGMVPYVDPDGLSFVERMRREDLL